MPSCMVTWKKMFTCINCRSLQIRITPLISANWVSLSTFWFLKLSNKLMTICFHASKSDSSLFIFCNTSNSVYVLIYMDDIIIIGSSSVLIYDFLTALRASFPVKDLGSLHYISEIEVYRNSHGLCMSQTKYVTDLLKRTNMHNSKLV